MPEVSRDQLNTMLADVPEAEHETFLQHLKGKGYTLAGAAQKFKPADLSEKAQGSISDAPPMSKLMSMLPNQAQDAIQNIGKVAETAESLGATPEGVNTEIPAAVIGLGAKKATALSEGLGKGAQKFSIPLTPAEITQSPSWAAVEKVLGNLPFSSGILKRFQDTRKAAMLAHRDSFLETLGPKIEKEGMGQAVKDALSSRVEEDAAKRATRASGKITKDSMLPAGKSQLPIDIGEGSQNYVDIAKKSAKEESGRLYKVAAEGMPDQLTLFDAKSLRNEAKKILDEKSGKLSTLPKGMEDDLKSIVNEAQGVSWDKLHGFQSDHGATAESLKRANNGFTNVESSIHTRLKNAARQDMERRATDIGGDFLEKYQTAKAFYKDYRNTFDNDTIRRFLNSKPDRAYDMFFKNGSVEDLRRLRGILGPEGMRPIRTKMVEEILAPKVGGDLPTALDIAKRMSDVKNQMREVLTPAHIEQLSKFAKTGEMPQFVMGELEKQIAVLAKKNPSAIVDTVMRGDPTITRAVKKVVGPEQWGQYSRAFVEKAIGEAGQEIFGSDKMGKILQNMEPEYRRLFISDSQLKEIENFKNLRAKTETAEKIFGNPSGTARNLLAGAEGAKILMNPLTGVPIALTPPVLAKFYTSDIGRRLLVDGLSVTEKNAAQYLARVSAFALNAKRENLDADRKKYGLAPAYSK